MSTPPTIVKGGPHESDSIPLHPPTPLPLLANSVVCIWPGVCRFLLLFFFFFLSPPLPSPFPSIVPPEVFMGRPTGCSAHQEIKVSSSSQCAVARCDLFNSNRVNITDACKAGITVAELDVLRRDTGSVFFLLWLTHENRNPFFLFFQVINRRSEDVSSHCGESLIISLKLQLSTKLGQFRERAIRLRWSNERKDTVKTSVVISNL